MSFSEKFNSKTLRAHKKSHDALFNSLAEKIRSVGLDSADVEPIISKLEALYIKKRLELETAAALGTLPDLAPRRVKKVAVLPEAEPKVDIDKALGPVVKEKKPTVKA